MEEEDYDRAWEVFDEMSDIFENVDWEDHPFNPKNK